MVKFYFLFLLSIVIFNIYYIFNFLLLLMMLYFCVVVNIKIYNLCDVVLINCYYRVCRILNNKKLNLKIL